MVTIQQLHPQSSPVIGQECRFGLVGAAVTSVDFFLEHQGILYPDRLAATGPDATVRLYLEVPGLYRLHATWQSASEESGCTHIQFEAGTYAGTPRLTRVARDVEIWMPSAWDAQLLGAHEATTVREVAKILKRGSTVYDIGANIGLFSVLFARAIGSSGTLYAIEPNPICVYFLRANLEQTQAANYTILPVAIARSRADCGFALNYGSSMLGVGSDSPYAGKHGHRIQVGGESLDGLIARLGLRPPDFIKLDVEGAEASAMEGMMKTIESTRPALMLELHGRTAARDTLKQLSRAGYRYTVPANGTVFANADDLAASFPDQCVQVIGMLDV
jgi:FkbM family methyltransferase